MSKEPRANTGHVCFGTRSSKTIESTNGSIVLVVRANKLSQDLSCGIERAAE